MKGSEIFASLLLGGTIISTGVVGTLYISEKGPFDPSRSKFEQQYDPGHMSFELADAFNVCRDRLPSAIPYQVRNIEIDHRSSHYEQDVNKHQVFMKLEVLEKKSKGQGYNAQVSCQVSAASNKVTSFRIRKL